jgi:hypothetical protein
MPVPATPAAGRSTTGFPEHLLWHRDLGHLEGDVAAVADHLGADLDQFLSKTVSDHASAILGIPSVFA